MTPFELEITASASASHVHDMATEDILCFLRQTGHNLGKSNVHCGKKRTTQSAGIC